MKVLAVAPHPDDETLGCGGALLRHKANGDQIYWLIVTQMNNCDGYSDQQIRTRNDEILKVGKLYGFSSIYRLGLPAAGLDQVPLNDIINKMGEVFACIGPQIVYLPYCGDIHSDHRVVFDAASACTKWFRYKSIKRVLAYETLSESEFGINPDNNGFRPNVYVNISDYLDKKIEILMIYKSEIKDFPFPRSEQAVRSLALVRGTAAGSCAAEAYMLLKEIL